MYDGAYGIDEQMEEVDELLDDVHEAAGEAAANSKFKFARDVQDEVEETCDDEEEEDEDEDEEDESTEDHEAHAAPGRSAAPSEISALLPKQPNHEPGQRRNKEESEQRRNEERARPSSSRPQPAPASAPPRSSSSAAIVGPAAIRALLAQALQLDSTRPSDAETLDRLLAALQPSDLAAFLPPATPAASIRATLHMARARRAVADRAHELQLARARSDPHADADSGAQLYHAAVRPTRLNGLDLAGLKRRVAHAWASYEQSGGALSPEHRYHALVTLLLPAEARAFRSDPAVAWPAITARPPAAESFAERDARFRGMLAALLAFCDLHPAAPAPLLPLHGQPAAGHLSGPAAVFPPAIPFSRPRPATVGKFRCPY